jgi:hypothetical protein
LAGAGTAAVRRVGPERESVLILWRRPGQAEREPGPIATSVGLTKKVL